ncbi:hypothetical protein Hanom_Chr05g00414891 [Helianthus anomalus]
MHEKRLRYWFVKDGKRKRTPKASPTVTAPKVTPKIVVKGIKSPPRLVDELVLDPADAIQQGVGLMKESLESFLKKNEEATTAKDQSLSVAKETGASSAKRVQTESLKEKEPEGVAHSDSSDVDDESTETESEIDTSKIGVGKVTLKKKPQQKKKGSDEEDSTYIQQLKRKRNNEESTKQFNLALFQGMSGQRKEHIETSKGPKAVKGQNVEVPEVQQVQSVEKKAGDDDEVVITDERVSIPPPEKPTSHIPVDAETSKPKKTTLRDPFEGFPNVQGEFLDDILPNEDYDIFHDATVKELTKKVSLLENEKAKAEAEIEALRADKAYVDDNAKLFEQLSSKLSEVNVKYANMNEANQTLHQMLDELHEASANAIKLLKLEIEALRADKAVKDEQLNMKSKGLKSEGLRGKKSWLRQQLKLKKDLIIETQEAGGSSSQGGDVEMVDVVNVEVEHVEVDQAQSFVLVGKAVSRPYNLKDVIRMVKLLCWKEEDEELKEITEAVDNYDTSWDDFKDDDEDQGSTGMLIVMPSVQQSLDDFLNDEINEHEKDQHQESSSSGKQHTNQVFLTQPTVIYLNAPFEGEMEVPRSRAEMLEELGLDDGNFNFDIEDAIPSSPEKEYEFKYANEVDNFDCVEVEECSDIFEEDTPFHYSCIDDTFSTLAETFKEQNEDEIRRKVVEKITAEGIPKVVPQETLLEGRKNWFKVMPKERTFRRPLQYITHNADISLGDILSWGYLEDLKVYAIRREQGVQYFEFLSDIQTLPWWDFEELVQTKNIKQFYYGLDVKQHDQRLWNYIKWQAKNQFPDWKPQYPKKDIKIDPVTKEKDITLIIKPLTKEKDITLIIKPPRCLKNMPPSAMEQDFHEDF